jgi:pimeloyl-ACP methyl ester carboxylesterase
MTTAFGATQTAKVNGTTLAYREEGEGEPVVFVHGTAGDLRIWDLQLPVIGRAFRAVAYSRRFARPNEDIDPSADDPMLPHVEDLAAFLQQIGAAPAHLVGSSWGAFISLLTAIRHPDLVRSLVLEEPPVVSLFSSTPPRPTELLRLFATRPRTAVAFLKFAAGAMVPAQKAFARGDDEKAMRHFLVGVLGTESYQRLPEASVQMMRENLSSARAQMLGDGFPPLGDDQVASVRAPTLLLTGEHSPDASHIMHEENAPAVNEAIVGFLRRHSR